MEKVTTSTVPRFYVEPKMDNATGVSDAFRENLTVACEEYGSAQRIIRSSGVGRGFFYKILRGESVPSLDVAARIAAAVGVPLEQMISRKVG